MKSLSLVAILAAGVFVPGYDALKPSKCGGKLTSPCLSASDTRYDANFPKSITLQNPAWKQFEGLWKTTSINFQGNGIVAQPQPHIPALKYATLPYTLNEVVTFYNHTIVGSRMSLYAYFFYSPAPESFCNQTFNPPFENVIGSGVCGVNGFTTAVAQFGTSTHENQGDVDFFRLRTSAALGPVTIDFDSGLFTWIDSNSLLATNTLDGLFSQSNPYTFLDNSSAFVNFNVIDLVRRTRDTNALAQMTRMEESEWLAAIEEAYQDINIAAADKIPVPFQTSSSDPEWYPTEDEWCGGVGNDPECTVSPYQEPDAKLKSSALVGFVILGLAVFCIPLYALYRYRIGQQERRIKDKFIRGIAKNMSIAPSAGAISRDKLVEEFQRIDKDKGGTIEKAELKDWIDEGKLGTISDADFNALWSALDRDGSGNIDFMEFCTFLSGCSEAFDNVYDEQQKM
jgi:hypothetical protein